MFRYQINGETVVFKNEIERDIDVPDIAKIHVPAILEALKVSEDRF